MLGGGGGLCRSQGRLGRCGETFVNIDTHLSNIKCIRGPPGHPAPCAFHQPRRVGTVLGTLPPHPIVLLKSETRSVLVNPRARRPSSSL